MIHEGLDYWQSIHGGKALPARSDLDPAQIPRLLPYLYLNEIHRDPLRVSYRVVGTRICQIEGRNKTGAWMHEEILQDDYEVWLADYRHVMEARQPLFGYDDLGQLDRSHVKFEWAIFPLSSDGQMVDMTFELEVFDNERDLLFRSSSPGLNIGTLANPAT